ncbi:hypothetical protein ACFPRA_15390 [Sporosarcina soli]|uniref:Capsule polysaccharide biosynthesis protein n=1 Tax=Sporosarcina soli TaxID=334736 RepID=A0ABW0TNA3_9BACL
MNTFLKNYWSLYLDFLNDFEALNYRGFSIPYLFCHFYSVIKDNEVLWDDLYNENFINQLNSRVTERREIQEVFHKYIQTHQRKPLAKNRNGKVVLHVDKLLRFPRMTLDDYFDASETIILTSGKSKSKKISIPGALQIPIDYLGDYTVDTKKAVTEIQNKAQAIFNSYETHHLYKDIKFQNMFLNMISDIINRIEQTKNFLDSVSVSCIVVSTTHSFISRILALVAVEKGIPTICMQHGIISGEFGYLPKIATIDAVYGNFEVEWYEKAGASEGSIEIIGHPRFDQAFSQQNITRSQFDHHLGINTNQKTLLMVMRDNQDIDRWRTLIRTISKINNLNLLIKNYPSKNPHTLVDEFPFVHSTKNYNLYDILPNVDCIVSYSSTVGLEAMLTNKPVFILNEEFPGYSGYFNGLDEMVQNDPKRLGELIIEYFENPDWNIYAQKKRAEFLKYAYPNFVMSGKRLKKLIERLTGQVE